VACRELHLSRAGYYEWRAWPSSRRDLEDAYLAITIVDVHAISRCSYGAPRVHAELRLGMGIRVGRKRVARLMRLVGRRGIAHRHKRRHRPEPAVHHHLVQRRFVASGPDRRWCTDITEHPTSAGKVYCCAVLDVFTRQVVGWSIPRATLPRPLRTGRRRPADGDLATPTDRHHRPQKPGSEYTSWVFGHRLRTAGLLGSMGRVASSVDNSMIESFWSTMQRELLDQTSWRTPEQFAPPSSNGSRHLTNVVRQAAEAVAWKASSAR
jgi:transposase InsO family protein